jgi:hypothetical protein
VERRRRRRRHRQCFGAYLTASSTFSSR